MNGVGTITGLLAAAAGTGNPDLPGAGSQAGDGARTTFDFARLYEFDDPRLFWLLFGGAALVLAFFAWRVYRRDAIEQNPVVGFTLLTLRLAAIAAALWFFLGLEKRTDVAVTEDSKVIVLVDSSLSMGLSDSDESGVPAGPSRSEQVAEALAAEEFLPRLARLHDVQVSRFDEQYDRVATIRRQPAPPETAGKRNNVDGAGQGPDADTDSVGAASAVAAEAADNGLAESANPLASPAAWIDELGPTGAETRLGDAVRSALLSGSGGPVAGIIVLSDGGQNAGLDPATAIELAQQMEIPVHTVGVGSSAPRRNVRVSDLVAPTRAYPGDSFTITGYLHGEGFANRIVDVELYRRAAADASGPGVRIATEQVLLPAAGTRDPDHPGAGSSVAAIRFEISPTETGRTVYRLAVNPPVGDVEPKDDAYEVDVDIVEQELQVLLFAGGASREYRFLRTLLYREAGVEVDVLLQSARPGISQDAREILDEFPRTAEDLYKYDAIVAFDPDWTQLDTVQLDLLEKWVADEAGGLVLVAGPIYTANWLESNKHGVLRALYPVEFRRRLALLGDARYGSKIAWPLDLTRDGQAAEFLKLDDTDPDATNVWPRFAGVYGYFALRGAKPTASVYAYSSDPRGSVGGEPPPYFVGQFYGSGRVFYEGSGEMWRLRALDESYFEVFYTKLLRHVTEGRLLRGSRHGVLLVDRDRFLLGDSVAVRAQLKDEQHRPLKQESVSLRVTRPDSTSETVTLAAIEDQEGSYLGQFRALQEGAYQLELPLTSAEDLPLTKRIHVRVPDLEREHPELNEELLSSIARRTNGVYYAGLDSAVFGNPSLKGVAEQIPSKAETRIIRGAPDPEFARRQSLWILGVFCGALSLEWLLRRICKLA